MNLNKVHLMGRLGVDPVVRSTQSGTRVATFSVATQEYVKSKDESETSWHRVVVWGKSAEFCSKFLKKGDPIHVEGTMKVRKYETDDGKTNYMHEVHTMKIQKLGFRKTNDGMEAVTTEQDVPHLLS